MEFCTDEERLPWGSPCISLSSASSSPGIRAEQFHNDGRNHIHALRISESKKKRNLDPPGMQGSAAQRSHHFLLGFQHGEGQMPQNVTLQVEIEAR